MPLDKAKIRRAFSSASTTYDPAADLQRTVAYALLTTVDCDMKGTLLDIGCGTGFLTQQLSLFRPERLIALDIALPMLQTARNKFIALGKPHKSQPTLVCADAEAIPLANSSINHVFSSLALQWCSNLSNVFAHIKRILKTDGRLYFSTFAPNTLQELKSAWASVDNYAHINDFEDAEQLEHYLRQAGFKEIRITRVLYTRYYDSVLALMQELKHIGAHNVRTKRNKHCTGKMTLQRMINHYENTYSVDGKIPASYEVFIVQASL
jgi:malonyl-CoA O-methyltransferase